MIKILIAAIAISFLSGCGPSCSDQGGKLYFSHYIYIYNGTVTTMTPVFLCRFGEDHE